MTFPTVRSGAGVALYPLTRSRAYVTTVLQFCDDSEQRWLSQANGLARFKLEYHNLNADDVNALLAFWRAQRGALDGTWTITVAGVTYAHMYFTDDNFVFQEVCSGMFDLTLACAQWRQN
jgi:hypothetical protein